jgi:hypothetical protein
MEFLFEHEKLRADEILCKVKLKNGFSPLKPLRSSKENWKKHCKQSEIMQIKLSRRRIQSVDWNLTRKSARPLFTSYLKNHHENWMRNDNSRTKTKEYSISVSRTSEKYAKKNNEEIVDHSLLPVIQKIQLSRASKICPFNQDLYVKNTQPMIAYVPRVPLLNDTM